MIPDDSDPQAMRNQRRFLYEVEQAVREANRDIIHQRIEKLDKATFVRFAKVVAAYRAAYLSKAMELSTRAINEHDIKELKLLREHFEETRAAFDALHRSIVRGYVDLAE